MRIEAMPRKNGRDRIIDDVDWIDLRPELVRPDGSWDIGSQTASSARSFARWCLDDDIAAALRVVEGPNMLDGVAKNQLIAILGSLGK